MRPSNLAPLLAAVASVYAKPPQPDFSNTTTLPTHYGVLVFPHFQALDVFGPVDVWNTLAMWYRNSTTMHMSVLSATMDPVFTGMKPPNAFGELVLPTITFADYLAKSEKGFENDEKGELEVLLIPGGGGTREPLTEEIAFVKTMYPKLKYVVSVCTGSTVLARAGVLDGRKATTNKVAWTWATSTGPNVTWVPTARWVEDGNIFSGSGITAGLDTAYAWVGHVYGEPVSDWLAKSLEHERNTDPHHDPFGLIWDVPGAT